MKPPLSAFDPTGEANPKLARFKAARIDKWSLRSSKSLWDMSDLATYLLALERYGEAADIGEFVSRSVSFGGNYNLWTPAACAIAIGVRAARFLGENERSRHIYEPIGIHPHYVINRLMEEQTLRETPDALNEKMFMGITRSTVGRIEDAREGRADTEWYPIAEMEKYLALALAGLRKSLSS